MNDLQREARRGLIREMLLEEGGPTRIKLCGMMRTQDMDAVNEALPDMVGFITDIPGSRRSLSSGEVGRLAALADEHVCTVSVSVNLPFSRVGYNARRYVDLVQLHGDEDELYIRGVRTRTNAGIIQAFQVHGKEDVERANRSSADMVLLDAGQGSGEQFDWGLLEGIRRPYILAGGLTPQNVAEAVRELRPWGVDLSSGLETNGAKDPDKIKAAVAAVRSAL